MKIIKIMNSNERKKPKLKLKNNILMFNKLYNKNMKVSFNIYETIRAKC